MGFFDLFKKKKDNTAPAATPEEQAVEAQQTEREEQVQKELDKWCVDTSIHHIQIIYNTKQV